MSTNSLPLRVREDKKHINTMKLREILTWIDCEMEYDIFYNVKSDKQKRSIIHLMDSGFLPDCEFSRDYLRFRKVRVDIF
ncbi:MAG: hypothetical protein GY756_15405 [bacterium]|nr:hypothetical protein [bacterium]